LKVGLRQLSRAGIWNLYPPAVSLPERSSGQRAATVDGSRQVAELREEIARLRASEQRLRGVFERIQAGFAVGETIHLPDGSLDFRYLDVNEAWERMQGMPRTEAVGRTLRDLLPEVAEDWLLFISDVARVGTPSQLCRYVEARDRWLEVSIFQPAPGQVAILFRDITDRKQAFDYLRESEDHYKHAVELNPQLSWTAKPDGRVDSISGRW